jgi:hypothetical protein
MAVVDSGLVKMLRLLSLANSQWANSAATLDGWARDVAQPFGLVLPLGEVCSRVRYLFSV